MANKKVVGISIDVDLHKQSVKSAKSIHSDFSKLVSMLLLDYHFRNLCSPPSNLAEAGRVWTEEDKYTGLEE